MRRKFQVTKSNGGVENFSNKKLYSSLIRSGLAPKDCRHIAKKVATQVREGSKTKEIYHKTLKLVKQSSTIAATHYSLKRAILDLGPTGHIFEVFVSRYFKENGFTTKTCQTIQGKFVRHEVDVIAEKDGRKYFIECKFHNRPGIKNDIKIALYVKARWDDLRNGPEAKNLAGFYLATNTAFSLDAITYANGTGLKLLGVNAPSEKSFLDEIKSMRLYPITSLRNINKLIRNELISKDVILAKEIPKNINLLFQFGMEEHQINQLLKEVEKLQETKI